MIQNINFIHYYNNIKELNIFLYFLKFDNIKVRLKLALLMLILLHNTILNYSYYLHFRVRHEFLLLSYANWNETKI